MEELNLTANSEMLKFMNEFKPAKYKLLKKGLEVRGIINIHDNIIEAKAIIQSLKLRLVVIHSAEMLTYRGFEVNYI